MQDKLSMSRTPSLVITVLTMKHALLSPFTEFPEKAGEVLVAWVMPSEMTTTTNLLSHELGRRAEE